MIPSNSLVFLIDDDASVRRGVSRLLRSAGYKNEAFRSASDFLAREQHSGPACLIVDVRMPELNGMDLQSVLVQRRREEQLVFITGHGDISMCAQAMKAGAVDFLTKPIDGQILLSAIRTALARDRVSQTSHEEMRELWERFETLTPREREVFGLVVAGKLNKQIAAELNMAERTVKAHRAQVMTKMRATSLADLVHIDDRMRM